MNDTSNTSTSQELAKLSKQGLWTNNPALVQLLGLCPLLAVTGTVVNAIGLGFATLMVLVMSNLSVSLIRNFVNESIRLPAFVMIIASLVTCAELLMKAFTYELYQILGIFIPLIVTNCAILGRADAYASKAPPHLAAFDGLMMGLGFMTVLVLLGALRELIGQGTLFSDMQLIFGEAARGWKINVIEDYSNFLFAILPPGAFVAMGLMIALKNVIDDYIKQKEAMHSTAQKGSKRVRVTGNIS